ncbi:pirin domain-protein domain-containing protein-containing protein [Ceratobasidium sp. AG-I]|nr:pirin domain-protein domain-containing protein-containing protein [Ceratobasidium sp. AG-I]
MAHTSKIVPRQSVARGHADYGWFKSFHTFSFAEYYDADYQQFGALRVINEDRMSAQDKLGMHPHREMEIFSYISSGQLTHGDSMQNVETIRAGDIQMTSAGTGIKHSEFNSDTTMDCHFLQIWALPHTARLTPRYYARSFAAKEKRDKLSLVVAPIGTQGVVDERNGQGPIPIHSHLALWATIMSRNKTLSHPYRVEPWPGSFVRCAYVHVAQTSGYNTKEATGATVQLNDYVKLREGDGAFVHIAQGDHSLDIANVGDRDAEVLVFDL